MTQLQVLADGLAFPEAPRWHDGELWFSDFYTHRVCRVGMDGIVHTVVTVAGQPSGLGWLPDGRLVVVSMIDRRVLRLDEDGLQVVAELGALAPFHCNDMVMDRTGRAYVGNFGFDFASGQAPRPTGLVRVTPAGVASVVARDLHFPNGTVITPDGRRMIIAETFARRLTAFDIDADGSLSGRRVWAELDGASPDGICLDAEGAVWVASPTSREVLRVAEGGALLARIPTERVAVACALGGVGGDTLFILSTGSVAAPPARALAECRGRIEWLKVDVPAASGALP